ncbi:hypothetical protein AMAG_12484 [Allomyces macrogynus ATCC 38327]|uniref:Disintegrin and metalloproteinase domain-containing protein B n=1 Tax=Allomyces macrogynus (strain ATCC 38327) TaxID=578462 RepID=A0A0L0SZC8_ALLM3|nr:hypothetical protein AMAG_12484 [Allomyces macrogynus ATCC 38327]|eukprot:KNE67760.1 hypothetical protein AMAG_12484 [Allomyces macrogynus ATCC 38327]
MKEAAPRLRAPEKWREQAVRMRLALTAVILLLLLSQIWVVSVVTAEAEADPVGVPRFSHRARAAVDSVEVPKPETYRVRGVAIQTPRGKPLAGLVIRGARDEYGTPKYVSQVVLHLEGLSDDDLVRLHLEINRDLIGPNYAHIMGGGEDNYEIHRARPSNCYYHGSVVDQDASLAAISLCNGIHGVIQFNKTHHYTIRPDDSAPMSHFARESVLPNGLSRPHVLIREVGTAAPDQADSRGHFCDHTTMETPNDADLDTLIEEAAVRMRRDAPLLQSAANGTLARRLGKRGFNNNKIIELMIASDYERYQAWGNQTESSVFNLVNYASLLMSNGLLPPPYTIRVTLVGQFTATSPIWVPAGNFTTPTALLSFCQWRIDRKNDPAFAGTFFATNDHAQVLTARTANGYAWLNRMCDPGYSCSLAPGRRVNVYAGPATAMAHEMGHNIGSPHDNDGISPCNSSSYIMNPTYYSSSQAQPTGWSSCSVAAIREYLARNATCLDSLTSPLCGNGIVDLGEECDSGNYVTGNTCCTPQCRWRPGAVCDDARGPCCRGCQIMPATTICRAATDPTCDAPAYCTGANNPACPFPTGILAKNGAACNSTSGAPGYCAHGTCTSVFDQCTARGYNHTQMCDSARFGAPCLVYCQSGNTCISYRDWRSDYSPCPLNQTTTGYCTAGTCVAQGTQIAEPSLCGNGVVDFGEQCDSGDTLVGSPCCTTTCQFRPGATCDKSNGPCCTYECQIAAAGTVCRASASPCDAADVCPGTNTMCPPDAALSDGSVCTTGAASGTCRTGMCILPTTMTPSTEVTTLATSLIPAATTSTLVVVATPSTAVAPAATTPAAVPTPGTTVAPAATTIPGAAPMPAPTIAPAATATLTAAPTPATTIAPAASTPAAVPTPAATTSAVVPTPAMTVTTAITNGTLAQQNNPTQSISNHTVISNETVCNQTFGNQTVCGGNGSSAARHVPWRTWGMGGWLDDMVAVWAVLGPVILVLVTALVPFV